jgi:hypothetical protein
MKIILISVDGKVKMPKIILLQQKTSIKRCCFQFKKERTDLRDPETMYLFRKYSLKLKIT